MARPPAPTLIERSLLLIDDQPDPARIEALVAFQRRGHRVLVVAPKPRHWRPTRNSVDHDLALQQRFHQMISRAGAELDGVVYFGTWMFSGQQATKDRFSQIASRYDRKIDELVLIGCDQDLLSAIIEAGGRGLAVGEGTDPDIPHHESLQHALAALD